MPPSRATEVAWSGSSPAGPPSTRRPTGQRLTGGAWQILSSTSRSRARPRPEWSGESRTRSQPPSKSSPCSPWRGAAAPVRRGRSLRVELCHCGNSTSLPHSRVTRLPLPVGDLHRGIGRCQTAISSASSVFDLRAHTLKFRSRLAQQSRAVEDDAQRDHRNDRVSTKVLLPCRRYSSMWSARQPSRGVSVAQRGILHRRRTVLPLPRVATFQRPLHPPSNLVRCRPHPPRGVADALGRLAASFSPPLRWRPIGIMRTRDLSIRLLRFQRRSVSFRTFTPDESAELRTPLPAFRVGSKASPSGPSLARSALAQFRAVSRVRRNPLTTVSLCASPTFPRDSSRR